MQAKEIPAKDWAKFAESFSQQHRGWRGSIDVDDPVDGAHVAYNDLVLDGVRAEGHSVEVICHLSDGSRDKPLLCRLPETDQLFVLETDDGAHAGLRAETEEGRRVDLWFRSAARPESVDGVSPMEGGV